MIFFTIVSFLVAVLFAISANTTHAAQDNNGYCGYYQYQETIYMHSFGDFPLSVYNEGEPIDGGTLHIGVASYSVIGMLNPLFVSCTAGMHAMQLLFPPLLSVDSMMRFSNDGAARFEYDLEALTFTIYLVEEMYWHDGSPLTLDDLLFAYEVIAHPDYSGPRFYASSSANLIVGIEDFREGITDTIAGIVLSDNNMTMTISFTEMTLAMLDFGIWTRPLPRHHFEGISVWDMDFHENSWHNVIGYGPFKLDYAFGDYFSLVRNHNFWMGVPYLEGITIEIISPSVSSFAMERWHFDVLIGVHGQMLQESPYPTNFVYLATFANSISFTGFRFGYHASETDGFVLDPTRVVADVNLRRAMGYAINETRLSELAFNLNSMPATTIVSPFQPDFWNSEMAGFSVFDPDLANRILDEAGYTSRDADGYRMTPCGQPITLCWLVSDSPINEIMVSLMMEDWANIGLRVVLWQDMLHPFMIVNDVLRYDWDYSSIDLFEMGFALNHNQNPTPMWGPYSHLNFARYMTPELDKILAMFASQDMFDPEFAILAMHYWQTYFYENVPAIPRRYSATIVAVNNRVQNVGLARSGAFRNATINFYESHLWRLTAYFPYECEKQ